MYKDPYREYIPQHPDLHKNFEPSGLKEGDKKERHRNGSKPSAKIRRKKPAGKIGRLVE